MTICVMLWAAPGREDTLIDYENRVLKRLGAYQGRLLTRVRALDADPTEVQVIEFPSEAALNAFQSDPERLALAEVRDRAIERTEVVRVAVVAGEDPPRM